MKRVGQQGSASAIPNPDPDLSTMKRGERQDSASAPAIPLPAAVPTVHQFDI